MSWRDELDVVLQEWIAASGGDRGGQRWRRVGAAQRGSQPGQYVVDTRASNLSADQVDELRLAGPDAESIPKGVPVMDAVFDGELLRLRVAEFANPAQPHLWRLQQEPGFLIKKLREGLAQLPDAGLANLLAQGETGGKLANVSSPSWLQNGQEKAYLACRGEGLWLVWGPPGTGKTRVLRSAIGDLLKDGKRVLLVSGTNVAVDNALNAVLKERHFERGEMVRVGPPHLREIADNPDISLPLMVRDSLAQLEENRHAAAEALLEMNARQERLQSLEEQVADFDPVAYDQAANLLAAPGGSVAELKTALAQSQEEAASTTQALEATHAEHAAAQASVRDSTPVRSLWTEVSRLEAELFALQDIVTQAEIGLQQAKAILNAAVADVAALQRPDGTVRWRDRRSHREAAEVLDGRRTEYEDLRASAIESRQIAEAARRANEPRIARLESSAPFGRDEIQRRDGAAALAEKRVRTLERARRTLTDRQRQLHAALEAARKADALYTSCNRRHLPNLYSSARLLRQQTKRDSAQRARLEKHHDDLQAQYERMSKNAQGEIIKAARLVATTLARFRIVKAVLDGPYDVVLIDEGGAATLPEVLLAVAKAGTCAVLLGDFMQLGPVFPQALKQSDRSDIRKWLITDPFRHCGISTLDEATNHPSCLVLDTQHRFGQDVMRLANLLAYDGLLKAGRGVRRHAEGDSEIVLIDTDGLGDLEQVQRPRPGAKSGWWPAGLLLSRMIVDMHRRDGETTGVVTPYTAQFEATLEALRDVERDGSPIADVGTAHRFQGREFEVVVFDTVESQYGKPMWIGEASRMPGSSTWQREGVRLFNVAATRVQHRLYVIASGQRIQAAPRGTALANLNTLVYDRQVTLVRAASLITPSHWEPVDIRPESTALAEVLARHIEVTDIDDERTFYPRLTDLIAKAQQSIWIWSGWVATRVHRLLPLLEEAAGRGVKITVFTRDPSDRTQGAEISAEAVSALRDVVDQVIEVNVAHQKVIVVDDHTVMMGSLNALSQRWTREVMITMRGQYFARRLLRDLHAVQLSTPPACGACHEHQVDLRRRRDDSYYWRCYNKSCPAKGKGRYGAWTEPVVLDS